MPPAAAAAVAAAAACPAGWSPSPTCLYPYQRQYKNVSVAGAGDGPAACCAACAADAQCAGWLLYEHQHAQPPHGEVAAGTCILNSAQQAGKGTQHPDWGCVSASRPKPTPPGPTPPGPAPPGPAPTPANPTFPCPTSSCWCAPTYAAGDISNTTDIKYGSAYNADTGSEEELLLDMYQPPARAGAPPRPAAVVIHGGGFHPSSNARRRHPTITGIAQKFARKGYVAVSIEYRCELPLEPDPRVFLDPVYDARTAVRWLVASAARYNIDASRITAFGASAGAVTVENLCLIPGDGNSTGNPGVPSNITAGVSLSGSFNEFVRGMADTAHARPLIDFHGTNDTKILYADAVDTKKWLDAHDVPNWLVTIPGEGHVPFGSLYHDPYNTDLWGFLRQQMRLEDAACPPQ